MDDNGFDEGMGMEFPGDPNAKGMLEIDAGDLFALATAVGFLHTFLDRNQSMPQAMRWEMIQHKFNEIDDMMSPQQINAAHQLLDSLTARLEMFGIETGIMTMDMFPEGRGPDIS